MAEELCLVLHAARSFVASEAALPLVENALGAFTYLMDAPGPPAAAQPVVLPGAALPAPIAGAGAGLGLVGAGPGGAGLLGGAGLSRTRD